MDKIQTMKTTVTTKNMVTIPAELSRRHSVTPGCKLDWESVSDSEIRVRVIPKRGELARRLMGRGRKFLRPGADPVRDLIEERVREDEEEYRS
jgi:bifunctional DNA-binding transcriptional regulator/antitoxin component of YhaV-PrlF toxin-antitoxin module